MYKDRRARLIQSCENIYPIIMTSHALQQSRADASHRFIQEANFLYLTGVEEAGWTLIIEPGRNTSYLIAPQVSEVHQLFDGSLSHADVLAESGVDKIISEIDGEALIRELSDMYDGVATLGSHPHEKYFDFDENPAIERLRASLKRSFKEVNDIRPKLSKLRAIKSADEIALMRRAISVTQSGFEAVRALLVESSRHEYELEAVLNSEFRRTGANGHAYEPIVAGGKNACTLHYIHNNTALPKDGLILIDAGAQVEGYAADITRTYKIGEPSEREKAVHAAVERAHHAIIALIRPGLSFDVYQNKVDEIMKAELHALGLLNSDEAYRTYFPHAISHGLGIDVHESLGGYKEFQPGMILTVEPGIYIPEEGIGVRIEDDILVTEDGSENLSRSLPTSL